MRWKVPIWVLPILFLAVGFAAGSVVAQIDIAEDSAWTTVAFGGDADSARSLVSNLLNGVVSITTLTLTVTIVSLQLASSQYSPRLMKRYLRDRSIQFTVAFFLFSFAFTLPVSFAIRTANEDGEESVPQLALSIVVVVSMLALVALVYFVFHVTRSVRVENVLSRIADEVVEGLDDGLRLGDGDVSESPEDARTLLARHSGFMTGCDREALAERLDHGDEIWFVVAIGDYVVAGSELCRIVGPAALDDEVLRHVNVAPERDGSREVAFGIRQITDVGVKALSPGVNDPTTAITSIHTATRTLVAAAWRMRDERTDADRIPVHVPAPSWSEIVADTIGQFAIYGRNDPQVVRALTASLERLVSAAPRPDHSLLQVMDSIREHLAESRLPTVELEHARDALDRIARLSSNRGVS